MSEEKSQPRTYTAWAVQKPKGPIEKVQLSAPPLGPNEVGIDVIATSICHSDLHINAGDWGDFEGPQVSGHEVVGVVAELGNCVKSHKVGDRVAVGWSCGCCGNCQLCLEGYGQQCSEHVPTCFGGHRGGFATYMQADASWAVHVPDGIADEHAAPLMCAGITCYTPLKESKPGARVGVVGVGGLGSVGIQLAVARGHETVGLTSSPDKCDYIEKQLGARALVTSDAEAMKAAAGTLDVIIYTPPNAPKYGWNALLDLLRPTGLVRIVGAVPEAITFNEPIKNIFAGKGIQGSLTGGRSTIAEMLRLAANKNVQPLVEVFDFEDIAKALEHTASGKVRFRSVLVHKKKD